MATPIADPPPNAIYPTPGQGITLDLDGKLPPAVRVSGSALTGSISGTLLTAPIPGSLLTGTVAGSLLTGTVASSLLTGTVPAAVLPKQVTGIIPASGTTPTAGTGFTYTHTNGTGIYVITFNPVFPATPVFTMMLTEPAGGYLFYIDTRSASSVTVHVTTTVPAAVDSAFNFVAQQLV